MPELGVSPQTTESSWNYNEELFPNSRNMMVLLSPHFKETYSNQVVSSHPQN